MAGQRQALHLLPFASSFASGFAFIVLCASLAFSMSATVSVG